MTPLIYGLLSILGAFFVEFANAQSLRVVSTVPELGDLAKVVGGENIELSVLARPGEDPHFVQAKPSFIKVLEKADVFLLVGLELEQGWAPLLLQGSRNPKIQPGSSGYFDASKAIEPLEVPQSHVTRAMGDVHQYGNPHYLLDPVNGLKVAERLTNIFGELIPNRKNDFEKNYVKLKAEIAERTIGKKLAEKYDFLKLMTLQENDALTEFLEQQGELSLLSGWLGQLVAKGGLRVIADHNLWPYFARRFGVKVEGFLEPKPGIAPTTKHLTEIVDKMKKEKVELIFANPYYDSKHAELVAKATGARILAMAHQSGSRPGINSYLDLIEWNVGQLVR